MPRSARPGSASSSSSGFELEDVAGVDRIGIAQPGLDLRHRQLARARGERRARRGRRQRPVVSAARRMPLGGDLGRLGPTAAPSEPDRAQHGVEPQQPARRHGRHALAAARRGSAPPPARRSAWAKSCAAMPIGALGHGDAEFAAHLPRHPRVVLGRARPAALVEPAEDEQVGLLQPRLDQAPDREARMAADRPGGPPCRRRALRTAPDNAGPAAAGNRAAASISSWQKRAAASPAASRHRPRDCRSRSSLAASRSAASICAATRVGERHGVPHRAARAARRGRLRADRQSGAARSSSSAQRRPEPGKAGAGRGPRIACFEPAGAGRESVRRRARRRRAGASARRAAAPARARSSARSSTRRRKAPGGVRFSGTPAESSISMPQRRSSAATRRASSRSGVTSAAVAPGVSSLRRSSSAIVTASSCGLAQSIAADPGEGVGRLRRQVAPRVGGGGRAQRLADQPQPARAVPVGSSRAAIERVECWRPSGSGCEQREVREHLAARDRAAEANRHLGGRDLERPQQQRHQMLRMRLVALDQPPLGVVGARGRARAGSPRPGRARRSPKAARSSPECRR